MIRFYLKIFFLFILISSENAFSDFDDKIEMKLEKTDTTGSFVRYYGDLDLRHYSNTYYDNEDYISKEDVSAQTRLRLGLLLYGGDLDISANVGFIKEPLTQKLIQRRPEIEVDYYPISNNYVNVVIYNLVQLPFSEDAFDEENKNPAYQGSVYTLGFSPSLLYPLYFEGISGKVRGGFDMWTFAYSRVQYVDESEHAQESDQFFLQSANKGEQHEATASTLFSQVFVGFSFIPGFSRDVLLDGMIAYNSEFFPKYFYTQQKVDYRYGALRDSYYKIKFQYAITDKVSFVNDFFHFHNGFFEAKKRIEDHRFRNIAKITCKL